LGWDIIQFDYNIRNPTDIIQSLRTLVEM